MGFSTRAEAALRRGGGRITRARRALLELIERSTRPLGPRELQLLLASEGVRMDRVSVYRNLSALLELGLLHRVVGSSAVRPCAEREERCHHAIVCSQCGSAPLRGARGALPSRHRLQPMRQRARVPLRRPRARAGGSPPRHPLPRPGPCARAARPVREVPAMMHAAALAGFSAVLGGAIALVARQRPGVLERTRTFAFAAAAGVVAFHLLPEALPSQGVAALLWMAAGFALPWLLEWLARTVGPGLLQGRGLSGLRVSAEVGFAALVFHSVAEGLALVAALAQPRASLDLEIAIVAHHAPLTAAVVLPFLDLRGPRPAAVRAGIVAAAGIGGALLSV